MSEAAQPVLSAWNKVFIALSAALFVCAAFWPAALASAPLSAGLRHFAELDEVRRALQACGVVWAALWLLRRPDHRTPDELAFFRGAASACFLIGALYIERGMPFAMLFMAYSLISRQMRERVVARQPARSAQPICH